MSLASKIRNNRPLLQKLGLSSFLKYKRLQFFPNPARKAPFVLHPPASRHPVYCRSGTTDISVLSQIFCFEEYSCLADVQGSGLILDLGANVGHSASYLLTRYPDAEMICVEPDPGNFELLRRTIAPYGPRVRAIRSGIWSETCGLVMDERYEGVGREWSRRIRPAVDGETPLMRAVDVASLLEGSGRERIFLLKVDVEGAEREVFGPSSAAWIDRVDNIVVELHGPDCDRAFYEAIAGRGFEVSNYGELVVCKQRA